MCCHVLAALLLETWPFATRARHRQEPVRYGRGCPVEALLARALGEWVTCSLASLFKHPGPGDKRLLKHVLHKHVLTRGLGQPWSESLRV